MYHHGYTEKSSLSAFLVRLEEKHKPESLQEQAKKAIKLYYEMLELRKNPLQTKNPLPVDRMVDESIPDSNRLIIEKVERGSELVVVSQDFLRMHQSCFGSDAGNFEVRKLLSR